MVQGNSGGTWDNVPGKHPESGRIAEKRIGGKIVGLRDMDVLNWEPQTQLLQYLPCHGCRP